MIQDLQINAVRKHDSNGTVRYLGSNERGESFGFTTLMPLESKGRPVMYHSIIRISAEPEMGRDGKPRITPGGTSERGVKYADILNVSLNKWAVVEFAPTGAELEVDLADLPEPV